MRLPPTRPQKSPPELPAQGCQEGNSLEPGNRFLGKKSDSETLVPFLVVRGVGRCEVNSSLSRYFRPGNSEDHYNPELAGVAWEIPGLVMMTYEDVEVTNWLRCAKIDRWAGKKEGRRRSRANSLSSGQQPGFCWVLTPRSRVELWRPLAAA